VRVNALSRFGREGVLRFDVRAVPTLLVFDGCGRVVERQVGLINRARAVEAIRTLDGCTSPDA
jgi:hypothetical protein